MSYKNNLAWRIENTIAHIANVSVETISDMLKGIGNGLAVFDLRCTEGVHEGSRLQFYAENSNYLLLYSRLVDDDHVVSSFSVGTNQEKHFEICGEQWDSKMVFHDINIAIACYSQFIMHGTVSSDQLD